jgi:hypothetical protein
MINQFLEGADETKTATTEDLVPTRLFVRAVERYLAMPGNQDQVRSGTRDFETIHFAV